MAQGRLITEQIVLLHANLDDMTGEALGFAQERLWDCGALDVYTTSIYMKKNRPGVMLSCICKPERKEACVEAYLRYTTTLGVRIEYMERCTMDRSFETIHTQAGDVRVKKSSFDRNAFTSDTQETPSDIKVQDLISKWKAEYEDLRQIALEKGISLQQAEKYLEGQKL